MTRPDHHLRSDDDLVTEIVAQLERGGPLNDPRDPRASSPADGDDLIIQDVFLAIKSMGLTPELKTALEAAIRDSCAYDDDVQIIWGKLTLEDEVALLSKARERHGDDVRIIFKRFDQTIRADKSSHNAWAPGQVHSDDRLTPLGLYVRAETQRCMSRVRMAKREKRPPGKPGPPTAADYKRAIKAMERIAFTDSIREQIEWAKSVQLFPPDKRADRAKWDCAEESWFLMEYFSAQPPTGTEEGAFRMIAELLFEGLNGKSQADMKRGCAAVLKRRRPHSWRWDITH